MSTRPPGRCLAAIALIAAVAAHGAPATRFGVTGAAALTRDATARAPERFALDAQLSASTAAAASAAPSPGRFSLAASLTAAATPCAADTVFRDGFDGSGL